MEASMSSTSVDRQMWIESAVKQFRKHFDDNGWKVPEEVRISIGIPKGMHGSKKAIGQCWSNILSSDGHYEIFVSPELGKEVDVLETIAHELIHATVGTEEGHKGKFKTCALCIGFQGPMTTTPPDQKMIFKCEEIIKTIGPYPAGTLDLTGRKKKATYLIKCECPECGYVVRTTAKWLEVGDPICPVDDCAMQAE
jgi:hypothetical protein